MKRVFYTICSLILLVSCQRTEGVIYDVENGVALAAFNRSSQLYPVDDSGANFTEVIVGVTTVSDMDRSVNLTVAGDSPAGPDAVTIDPSSLVIPAGEFIARVRVQGNYDRLPELGQTQVILNLEGVEGAILDGETTGRLSHRVTMFRFCPFGAGQDFLGTYQLTVTQPGLLGIDTFATETVELTQGETVADREFSSTLYPAFGGFGPYSFSFSLICGEVVVSKSVILPVGCANINIVVSPPQVAATYDENDDSSISINFTDDRDGSCGEPVPISILLTKV
ncbi:hypothetical protein [Robiginitalea sp. SC105]|uniref:hypothetical protein n=1 Tax=Robiginitalea sp. SC105 TaxID=2762332 RepID=UPI00163AC349|nr:hypothetical protein [Robiginitalea sp. SC105]MBC2838312.1 hypothetical protein [Robiginitalea sp. SC105]